MTDTYDDMIADRIATECETQHTERHDDCEHCTFRATLQSCGQCGADFVDGKWWNVLVTCGTPITGPNGCDHEALVDAWGNEIVCSTIGCHDSVETAGRWHCPFHAREADAVEADRIYQRLVAVR